MRVKGRVWVFGDNIDTDAMYPARAFTLPDPEKVKLCMESLRPGWSSMVRRGDIIVAGHGFGVGSSRPASRILKLLGIQAVLAESVSGVFMRNSINYGLICLECPGVRKAFTEGDVAMVDLDEFKVYNLSKGGVLECRRLPDVAIKVLRYGGVLEFLREMGCLGNGDH